MYNKIIERWNSNLRSGNQRRGQALFNAIAECNFSLAVEIINTDLDCFFDDSIIPQTLEFIKK